jgi:tryptophanyl-tRNA synthetase
LAFAMPKIQSTKYEGTAAKDKEPMTKDQGQKRVLSGIQPSGKLHLGNYFGAIKQHIALQNEATCFYFLADYHALTTIHDPQTLRRNVRDAALDYLALGLDPEKATFFRQSDVPEVTELAWILATVTNMGLLERAVSYKEKIEKGIEASVGLFTYPVLMAADILIYRSHLVPVGKDQVQHIEMTQDMAGRFNRAYGEVFPIPNYRLDKDAKVPGTDGQKMSKSYGNAIEIFAEGKPLKKTVMGIVTEGPGALQRFRPVQPVCDGGGEGGLGRPLPRRRNGLRRSQGTAARKDHDLFRGCP